MKNLFDTEFINALLSLLGADILTDSARIDLAKHYPEKYTKGSYNDSQFIIEASEDYLKIIRYYMIFHRIPFTIESITAGFMWGVGNLRKQGIENAPPNIKQAMMWMRKTLEPMALDLDSLTKDNQ